MLNNNDVQINMKKELSLIVISFYNIWATVDFKLIIYDYNLQIISTNHNNNTIKSKTSKLKVIVIHYTASTLQRLILKCST